MKFYFFEAPPQVQLQAFRQEYALQNLKKLRLVACVVMSVSGAIVLLPLLFPFLNQTLHATFFRGINICLVVVSAFILNLEHVFFHGKKPQVHAWLAQLLCLAFGFAFIACCLSITFMVQANPKNTLTMYLLGLVTVAFLWDFEYLEALVLVALTALAFTGMLHFLPLNPQEKIMNQCVSFFILVCFFVLSRTMYSYRAAHFRQLREIEAQNRKIERISQAKSEILGVVAHDLRSPFNNIEMLTSLLQKKDLRPEQHQQYLDLILTSCLSSKAIINDLLVVAREDLVVEIPMEKLDLCEVLQQVHLEWQSQLQGSRSLQLQRPPVAVYANLNKDRFHRVLDNLLSNAVKFTPLHGTISIKVREGKKNLHVEVTDEGIGIPEKIRPILFERFSKARRRGLKGEKSTGLGLSICRQLVEQHGGSIDVESEERKGTTFHIRLPAAS